MIKMKIRPVIKISLFFTLIALLIRYINEIFSPVSYKKIVDMNKRFKEDRNVHDRELKIDDVDAIKKISSVEINRKLDEPGLDLYLMVDVRGTRLQLDATSIKPSMDDLKRKHEELKQELKNDNNRKTIIGLKDFPSVITAKKTEFTGIRALNSSHYLFFLSIEDGWPLDPNIPIPAKRKVHFTVGVLAGDAHGNVDPSHQNLYFKLTAAVPGRETWPYADFIWYDLDN
jgi:hypothetical protein